MLTVTTENFQPVYVRENNKSGLLQKLQRFKFCVVFRTKIVPLQLKSESMFFCGKNILWSKIANVVLKQLFEASPLKPSARRLGATFILSLQSQEDKTCR